MSESLITETGFDRAAIMRLGWALARDAFDAQRFLGDRRPALRHFLSDGAKAAWHLARQEAKLHQYAPERRAAIKAAEFDLLAANCIDNFKVAKPAVAAAQARLDEARRAA